MLTIQQAQPKNVNSHDDSSVQFGPKDSFWVFPQSDTETSSWAEVWSVNVLSGGSRG